MSNIKLFQEYYKDRKKQLEERILKYREEECRDNLPFLQDNLDYFYDLNAGGKRIRGVLCSLGYELLKDDPAYSFDLALAYELFQTAILVHDDFIDQDQKRRGIDTIHYANEKKYSSISSTETKHFASSIAICMGDYGLFKSNQVLVSKYYDNPYLNKVFNYFFQTVLTTIRGELMDVILPFEGKNDLLDNVDLEKSILDIYRLKTSYYTIIGPLVSGLLLAGGNDTMISDIEKFGEKIGIGFQIQDDILGIYSEEMGKVQGSDIKEYKQTILFSHIMNTPYRDEFLKYYGNTNMNEDIIKNVQELFHKSGSYDYATSYMNRMYDEAIDLLENIDWIDDNHKKVLLGFIEYLRDRKV
ncbi:MAG: polyprenyl synthetase family protein [Bacilli bacterium]|nr:polyprenyl synthetase family protein [Bacilli bacterium]